MWILSERVRKATLMHSTAPSTMGDHSRLMMRLCWLNRCLRRAVASSRERRGSDCRWLCDRRSPPCEQRLVCTRMEAHASILLFMLKQDFLFAQSVLAGGSIVLYRYCGSFRPIRQ